jgi:hypothetical protein
LGKAKHNMYIHVNQKLKTMNKLLVFRVVIITFLITNFIISFTLETEADVVIMFFTFLMSLGYLGAEMIIARDEAE